MRIRSAEVPVTLRRRAAQLLESLRGTPMGKGLESVRLADDVTPLYRPGVNGVAYYEFAMQRPSGSRRGFVVVSAGVHDFPHAHFSARKPPVTEELSARARKAGRRVARVYKVDAIGYVAEDEQGEEIARLGSTGAVSWRALKNAPSRAADRHARTAWEIAELAARAGEGLLAGEPFRVALLERDAQWSVAGEASRFLEISPVDHPGGASALELMIPESVASPGAELTLRLRYPSGLSESLKFFVVMRRGQRNGRRGEQSAASSFA